MKLENVKLSGGDIDRLFLPRSDTLTDPVKNSVSAFNGMMKRMGEQGWIDIPSKFSDVFRFRHINHDTEGWADIVIVQAASARTVRYETDYRAALQEVGFDTYFNAVSSWRNAHQDWGPDEVPELNIEGGQWYDESALPQYVLIERPDMNTMPLFLYKVADSEYGKFGNGTWIQTGGRDNPSISLELSTLYDARSNYGPLSSASYSLGEGQWIMGADPDTNFR